MMQQRSRRLLGGLVILAGMLLLAEAAHAACIGQAGNWVACPSGVPANATITSVTFFPKGPNTVVTINVPPFSVNLAGLVPLTSAPPDTANDYAALKFLDYSYRMPDGGLPFGRAWPRFGEVAQDVRASLLAPPLAIRRSDAATAGVPELLPPAAK
jgi:hypothetical protein